MILKDWLGPLLRGKFQSILWPGLFFIAKLHNHSLHKKALPEGRQSFVPGDPVSGGPVLASVALSTFTKTDPLAVDLDSTRWVAGLVLAHRVWMSSNYFHSSSCCLYPVHSRAALSVYVNWPALTHQLGVQFAKMGPRLQMWTGKKGDRTVEVTLTDVCPAPLLVCFPCLGDGRFEKVVTEVNLALTEWQLGRVLCKASWGME